MDVGTVNVKNVFFAAAVVSLVVGFSLSSFRLTRSAQRRIYWLCACLAAMFGFLAPYPKFGTGFAVAVALFGGMVVAAYLTSSYIKIGGKVYALTVADSQPDPVDDPSDTDARVDPAADAYSGQLTPVTMWWMLVVLAVIAGGNAYAALFSNGEAWVGAMSAGFAALLAIGAGYTDGSWDYQPARRQYLQLALASVVTAGGFALLYFAAFYTARRRPLRRSTSLDPRARPRHLKRGSDD
jgi:hypothetical protein